MPTSRHLKNLIESAIDFGIIVTDLKGLTTDWNAGAERILGWSRVDIVGEPAERFFTPEDVANGRVAYEMTTAFARVAPTTSVGIFAKMARGFGPPAK